MAEPISVTSVTKTYPGSTVAALKSVSLDVAPGTFLVLLGPSGSGKTTLLRCLAGIERIDSGALSIGARVVAEGRVHVPPEQRDLSMVFQDYALWPHLTALDNVAFALRRRRLPRPARRARAQAMLSRVGLAEFAGRYPNELSGGQQQRVALARALIADTGLILCDEPLSNLDADLRERMRVEISALVREAGATTVYITHDQAEAFALADRIGVLEEGVLVQSGSPEDVYHYPATPFVARFTGLAGELPVRVAGYGRDGALEITASGVGGGGGGAGLGGAGLGLAWGWLGWRLYTLAVWLTVDSVIVRNVWQTRRLPLTDITAVNFRQGTLSVTTRWSAAFAGGLAPAPGAASDQPGRHVADGPRLTLRALSTGTAHLTGRRRQADQAADAITAAAGLRPLPAREERISLRRALVMGSAGLAFLVAGQLLEASGLPPRYAGSGSLLSAPGAVLLFPAVSVTADHLFHRTRPAPR